MKTNLSKILLIKTTAPRAAAIVALLAACLAAAPVGAADTYESFTYDGRDFKQARLVEVNPLELAFMTGNGEGLRIKRQDLPGELKSKYPFEPVKAARFEIEREAQTKIQHNRERVETYAALVRQEQSLQSRLEAAGAQMVVLQKEINVLRSKPKGHGKTVALQLAADRKLDLVRQCENYRTQTESVRALQRQYR